MQRREGFGNFLPWIAVGVLMWALGCTREGEPLAQDPPADSATHGILWITMDTTRADRLGFEGGPATPALDQLAEGSLIYRRAYTTAPTTLPSHVSMLTGLYPFQHGIHENARYLNPSSETLAEVLSAKGYATAAFVSGYPLDAVFGIDQGFDQYSDPGPGNSERLAAATTAQALAYLEATSAKKLFLWVHYYDPHAPYQPPEPFASRYPGDAYQGEIASMDAALGKLVAGFRERFGKGRHQILVVGDHGEGLGEGGEAQHGHLLSTGVVRVPMLLSGTGINPGEEKRVVSIRRVFDLVKGLAEPEPSLKNIAEPVVLAEAMKPFLQYGWAPQTLAVSERWWVIRDMNLRMYDVLKDPGTQTNLFGNQAVPNEILAALKGYPLPATQAEKVTLSQEEVARLASLGYSASQGQTQLREGMPNPSEMMTLLPILDTASQAFANGHYIEAATAFTAILQEDPTNLMAHLRLAVSHSQLGKRTLAEQHFSKAGQLSPDSIDVRHYLGMHFLRFQELDKAADAFSWVLERQPERITALKALANLRLQQGNSEEAAELWRKAANLGGEAASHVQAANLFMQQRNSQAAAHHFSQAAAKDPGFSHHLEWGVVLLDMRQLDGAAAQLEKVSPDHPAYSLALFKRAQTGALRNDSDVGTWIQKIREQSDPHILAMLHNDGLLRPYLLKK